MLNLIYNRRNANKTLLKQHFLFTSLSQGKTVDNTTWQDQGDQQTHF